MHELCSQPPQKEEDTPHQLDGTSSIEIVMSQKKDIGYLVTFLATPSVVENVDVKSSLSLEQDNYRLLMNSRSPRMKA